jgi:hypothetical protein
MTFSEENQMLIKMLIRGKQGCLLHSNFKAQKDITHVSLTFFPKNLSEKPWVSKKEIRQ